MTFPTLLMNVDSDIDGEYLLQVTRNEISVVLLFEFEVLSPMEVLLLPPDTSLSLKD